MMTMMTEPMLCAESEPSAKNNIIVNITKDHKILFEQIAFKKTIVHIELNEQ
jgi:hypothetical protein